MRLKLARVVSARSWCGAPARRASRSSCAPRAPLRAPNARFALPCASCCALSRESALSETCRLGAELRREHRLRARAQRRHRRRHVATPRSASRLLRHLDLSRRIRADLPLLRERRHRPGPRFFQISGAGNPLNGQTWAAGRSSLAVLDSDGALVPAPATSSEFLTTRTRAPRDPVFGRAAVRWNPLGRLHHADRPPCFRRHRQGLYLSYRRRRTRSPVYYCRSRAGCVSPHEFRCCLARRRRAR